MAVPSACGKLQSPRELGAETPVARGAVARRVARPVATVVIMLAACAAALAVTAQGAARAPRDLLVSSLLERIGATPAGDAAGASESHADELIVSVRFTNSGDY